MAETRACAGGIHCYTACAFLGRCHFRPCHAVKAVSIWHVCLQARARAIEHACTRALVHAGRPVRTQLRWRVVFGVGVVSRLFSLLTHACMGSPRPMATLRDVASFLKLPNMRCLSRAARMAQKVACSVTVRLTPATHCPPPPPSSGFTSQSTAGFRVVGEA